MKPLLWGLAISLVMWLLIAVLVGRAVHAQEIGTAVACVNGTGCTEHPEILPEIESAAAEAGVEPIHLLGALNSLADAGFAVTAREYLFPPPPPVKPTGRLACISYAESLNNPNATNRSSGAMGLFQFLPSTWRTTPQGRAGLSAYDPVAATAAAEWMVAQGRIREWTVIQLGIC